MASIRQHPKSPFWIACFMNSDGSRTTRSTGVPVGGVRKSGCQELQGFLSDLLGVKVAIANPDQMVGGSLDAREARRLAQRIAEAYEDAAREAKAGRLIESQARKVIADIYQLAHQEELSSSTAEDF